VISNPWLVSTNYTINDKLLNGTIHSFRIGHLMKEFCALVTLS
jgi:hypothetical protein